MKDIREGEVPMEKLELISQPLDFVSDPRLAGAVWVAPDAAQNVVGDRIREVARFRFPPRGRE